jgi:hypothetical protein
MRWDQELNRRTLPFAWGLEHIGGSANETDPRGFLERFTEQTIAHSDEWFATDPATDYKLEKNVVTFSSALESPWAVNNLVHAQLFPEKKTGPAVIVLAQWNARWEEQQSVCRWLNRLGITSVKMSLPYHDRRSIPGHPRGDHLVGSNIGLTIQANRQAVLDVRRTLRWLEQEGYGPLGILGTSIGSCIGFIAMCHEPAVRAGAFLHVSSYFGEVVANGLTTANVWGAMKEQITEAEVLRYWSPISPFPYIGKIDGTGKRMLAISGRYDPTFWPGFTNEFLETVRAKDIAIEELSLPCGHYSLGVAPFSYMVGHRFGKFLSRALSGRKPANASTKKTKS